MRTWLAKAVSDGRQFAQILTRTVAATIAVLTFGSISALAQPAHEVGGEAQHAVDLQLHLTQVGLGGFGNMRRQGEREVLHLGVVHVLAEV